MPAYEIIPKNEISIDFADWNDPDAIGMEFSYQEVVLFTVTANSMGRQAVVFGSNSKAALELTEFRRLLDHAESEISEWRAKLLNSGAWEKP